MPRPIARGLEDCDVGIQFKGLGQITGDQVPAPGDHTVIHLGFTGQDAHEGRFASTVATHKPDAIPADKASEARSNRARSLMFRTKS